VTAVAAAHHSHQHGAGQLERGCEVDRDHPVPVLVGEADEERVAGEARIVDQDVEVAHRRLGRRHQGVDRGAIGQIAREDMDALTELGGERLERLATRPREPHGRTLLVKRAGDAAADRAARARHQGLPAAQIEHGVPRP
jgi:hypothetical protein